LQQRRATARCKEMNQGDGTQHRLSPGGWAVIVILVGFLVVAIAYAIYGWNRLGVVGIPPMGWLFLIAGIVLTLGVGGGLMALMFYSSRKGRDF
jgi:flagellar basal body-associated protein FliL